MSDLQCAATVLLARHGEADQGRALGQSLRDSRLAMIYVDDSPGAGETAEIVAAATRVPITVLPGLGDGARVRSELEGIADLHRGETVLVVSHLGTIETGVRRLHLDHGAVVEVAGDADGWVLRSRAGDQATLGTGGHWS
jgi:broad specificity phosphatase PhoE